jgi:hypothetical protein
MQSIIVSYNLHEKVATIRATTTFMALVIWLVGSAGPLRVVEAGIRVS